VHQKRKKRKDYAFWRQFNEKPSIIWGCPGSATATTPMLTPHKTKAQETLELLAEQVSKRFPNSGLCSGRRPHYRSA